MKRNKKKREYPVIIKILLWSVAKDKLEVWLSENGLLKYTNKIYVKNRYANAFHRNHITYDMLGSLNDEDIDNLEMHNDADINRFRKAIAGLNKVSMSFY